MTFRPSRSVLGLFAASLLALPAMAQQMATQTAPATTATRAFPDARALVAQVDKAMGAEALAGYDSRMIRQQMTMEAQGLTVDLTIYNKGGDQVLIETSLPGMTMKQGYDGVTAWATDPMQGPRLLSEAEAEQMRNSPDNGGSLLEAFPTVEVLGEEDFEGRACWRVSMKSASGLETIGFFDQETHLINGMSGKQPSPMGEMPYSAVMTDYVEHHGMMFPGKTTVKAMGIEQVVMLKEVKVNLASLPSFAPPPEVAALIEKGAK